MTWFIDTTGFPKVATVDEYAGGTKHRLDRVPTIVERKPFTDDLKQSLPTSVSIHARDDGYIQHIIIDQLGFLVLSATAIEILRNFQSDGWEAFELKAMSTSKAMQSKLAGDVYYILNVYLHKDLIDLEKSDLLRTIIAAGRPYETTTYGLAKDQRKVAIKHELIGDTAIWMGRPSICGDVVFVANRLKESWCEIGMNPEIFGACQDI